MPLPLIPFVAGAVVGGLAMQLYRDPRVRAEVKGATDELSARVKDGIKEGMGLMGLGEDETPADVEKPAAKSKSSKKASARRASSKKTSVKKAARKKATRKRATAKKESSGVDAKTESPGAERSEPEGPQSGD